MVDMKDLIKIANDMLTCRCVMLCLRYSSPSSMCIKYCWCMKKQYCVACNYNKIAFTANFLLSLLTFNNTKHPRISADCYYKYDAR